MNKMELELDAPNVGKLEKQYIGKAIDSGFVSTFGPFVSEFEKRFARYVGVKRAVAVQSGTEAIHSALYELGIGKGDEVIVPVLTFVATVNPVMYVGAKPVFADVDIKTWNIDPAEIEKNITKKTKAIIPVHLYGNPCNMDRIMNIARKHKLYVIEDATESIGATYGGRHTGTFGDIGCFSFNGNKMITTGGGGMVVAKDKNKLEHIKFLANQARDVSRGYYHPEIGFNYRLTNLEAVLGLAQMKRLNQFLAKKRKLNAIYRNELKDIKGIRFQEEHRGARADWWMSCIVFDDGIDIPKLQKQLKQKGIPTRKIWMPITGFPPYKKFKKTDYKNAYRIYENGLCLPSSTLNSLQNTQYVCKAIQGIVKRYTK